MKEEKHQDAMLRAREKMQKMQDEKASEYQLKEEEVREGGKEGGREGEGREGGRKVAMEGEHQVLYCNDLCSLEKSD